MLHSAFNEKGQSVISGMRNYLLECGLQNHANAFDKAIAEVVSYETEGVYRNHYSKKVNRYLCEALLYVNTDVKTSNTQKKLVRGLIESYRNVYGLSTEDFGFEYTLEV
jgi:hypothetical protein